MTVFVTLREVSFPRLIHLDAAPGRFAMKLASRPPLRRLLALDQMIRQRRYPNARTAARDLEVNRRTILRDLDFLRDSWGAPVEYCHKHNGYFYHDADFSLPFMRMTEGELIAFFLAERLMEQYRDSPFAKDLATAFQKLTAALPDEVSISLDHLGQAYSFRSKAASAGDVTRFRQLVRAVREGRQLELVYWSASRDLTGKRVVDPYHLASVDGDWYLIGHCHLREDVRMFVPSRIRWLRETGKRFERPAEFDINNYLDSSFRVFRGNGPPQRVRLRFAASAAPYVREKVWHSTQQITPQRDGGLILTMEVSHLLEVKRWVMSWGSECRVLEPVALGEAVRLEMRKALGEARTKQAAGVH